MRPFCLDPLFKPLAQLNGVGPKLTKLYEKLFEGSKVRDLLFHAPIDMVDREACASIAAAPYGRDVILTVSVEKHTPAHRRPQPYRIRVRDSSGFLDLVFFNAHSSWLLSKFPVDKNVIISGKIEEFKNGRQITHPDILTDTTQTREPIYPLTAGVTNKMIRKIMHEALDLCPTLPEWHSSSIIQKYKWAPWKESILNLHDPKSSSDLDPN